MSQSLAQLPLRETTSNSIRNINRNEKDAVKEQIATQRIAHTQAMIRAEIPRPLKQPYLLRDVSLLDHLPTLTVVFDLDETLVSNRRADLPCAILRPYALHVLNALRQMPGLEIVLWTASTSETGTPVVHQLQERGDVFDEVIFRNSMWFTEPVHTKDLRLLGRDLSRVVVFDNAPNCCKLNPQSAVLVEDFHGRPDDFSRHDGSLVNLYYIIDTLVNAAARGESVPSVLDQLRHEGQLCYPVSFALPESWASTPLHGVPPLMIPPHGSHTRATFESAAPLEPWTI